MQSKNFNSEATEKLIQTCDNICEELCDSQNTENVPTSHAIIRKIKC